MKKKEMEKRINDLEDQMQRMERRRDLDVKVIQNMAKKLHFDIEELLRESYKPGINYRCEQIKEEELDLPHEILKLIFDKSPEGISVGEIRDILKEIQNISEDIQMVL